MRLSKVIPYLTLMIAISGCGGSSPSTPTPPPQMQKAVQLAVFMDPTTSYSTSDVRDAQDRIVRFDTANNALIWAADGRSFSGYPVSENFIGSAKNFQIRFGTDNGRHAYFTETVPETICNIDVVNGQLLITPTSKKVPQG